MYASRERRLAITIARLICGEVDTLAASLVGPAFELVSTPIWIAWTVSCLNTASETGSVELM